MQPLWNDHLTQKLKITDRRVRNVSPNAQIIGLYKGNYKCLGILLLENKQAPKQLEFLKYHYKSTSSPSPRGITSSYETCREIKWH